MRQGHTTAIPVTEEIDPDNVEVSFTVTHTIKVKDLHNLHLGLDRAADFLDFSGELYPVVLIAAQAYEAAKTQLGVAHVNGKDGFAEADLILPIVEGIKKAEADGTLDEVEALAIAGDPDDLAKFLGVSLPAAAV